MSLKIKPANTCTFDEISLGEIMLRLDPGEGRIRTAREFKVWEGGGEYNVARGLRKCFGLRTSVCTAFVENDVGRLVEDFIMQGGVNTDFIKWRADDGIGRSVRNGLNFTERGFNWLAAVLPRSGIPTAPRIPKPRSVKLSPLRTERPMPSSARHLMKSVFTPPCMMKSSTKRPTSFSTNAVLS